MLNVIRRNGIALAIVAGILVLTLAPAGADEPTWTGGCLICGERGAADATLNVILFLPLGIALGLRTRRLPLVVLIGFVLSGAIELIQTVIPGRYPGLGDLVWNTLGTALGALISARAGRLLFPDRRQSAVLAIAWLALGSLIMISTGLLLRPIYPDSVYYGQWTPDLGHLGHYDARVLDFEIAGQAVPSGKLADSKRIRAALLKLGVVRVRAIAGPPTDRLSSLVSIYDERQREIMLLGPDRDDLVYRYRTWAATLRFDAPLIRFRGTLSSVAEGDTLRVEVRPLKRGLCMSVAGASSCGLGFTIGSGWAVLYPLDGLPLALVLLIKATWLAALAFPGAFWARSGPVMLGYALALAMGLLYIPKTLGLDLTTNLEFAGASSGLILGLAFGWSIGRRNPRKDASQTGEGQPTPGAG